MSRARSGALEYRTPAEFAAAWRARHAEPARRIHDVRTACQFSMTLMAGNLQHAFLLQLVVIEPRVLCFFPLSCKPSFSDPEQIYQPAHPGYLAHCCSRRRLDLAMKD
jgi:hypothetical protein